MQSASNQSTSLSVLKTIVRVFCPRTPSCQKFSPLFCVDDNRVHLEWKLIMERTRSSVVAIFEAGLNNSHIFLYSEFRVDIHNFLIRCNAYAVTSKDEKEESP